MAPPTWDSKEALAQQKREFLNYWKPKVEEIVGPEDAGVFERELERLMSTCAANARSAAETKAAELRSRVQRALESISLY